MLLRVQSRLGTARIKVAQTASVLELKQQIEKDCSVPVANQKLTVRGKNGTTALNPDKALLSSFSLANGEMIYLDAAETRMTEKEIEEAKKDAAVAAVVHSGDRTTPTRPTTAFPGIDVKEDDIDMIIRQQDGWVKRKRSTLCQHPTQGQCTHCMDIAPWNVSQHPEFSELNLKHIAFHAWLREKEYNSPNNPVYLEDPSWRVDNANMITARQAAFSVVLERQTYRHVDHVEFEDPKMLDNFIGAWRATGRQRCGYLFGKYVQERSGIPLGISATVCAIYEPPQKGTVEDVVLLKDPNEAAIDALAEALGLVRLGFIWTALRVDQARKIIPDRDPLKYVLTSNECIRMCGLQNKYPSPCKQSNTGKFGSKFVSVLVYGNAEGNIEISAYQMSNQVARLVRDGVVRATKKDPGMLRVRESTPETLYPDVYYNHRNEYNLMVQSKADPGFPNEFGIVSLRHSFPINPNPLFKLVAFPIENRTPSIPNPSQVQSAFHNKAGAAYAAALSDFHLILYVALQLPEFIPTLAQYVTKPGQITEAQLRPTIDAWLKRVLPASSPSASSSSSPAPGSSTAPKPTTNNTSAAANLPQKGKDIVKQLVNMGIDEKRATEAVWATNMAGVEQALTLCLD